MPKNDSSGAVHTDFPVSAGRLDGDWYCITCQYNLRTLPVDGLCPECRTPVRESLRSPAEIAWLGGVARGLTWLLAAAVLQFVSLVQWEFWNAIPFMSSITDPLLLAAQLMDLAGAVLLAVGTFLATRLPPVPVAVVLPSPRWRMLGRTCSLLVIFFAGWSLLRDQLPRLPLFHAGHRHGAPYRGCMGTRGDSDGHRSGSSSDGRRSQ